MPAVRRHSAVCATVNKDFDSTRATTGRVKASARSHLRSLLFLRLALYANIVHFVYTLRYDVQSFDVHLKLTGNEMK